MRFLLKMLPVVTIVFAVSGYQSALANQQPIKHASITGLFQLAQSNSSYYRAHVKPYHVRQHRRGGYELPRGQRPTVDIPRGRPPVDLPRGRRPTVEVPPSGRPPVDLPRGRRPRVDIPQGRPPVDLPRGDRPVVTFPR